MTPRAEASWVWRCTGCGSIGLEDGLGIAGMATDLPNRHRPECYVDDEDWRKSHFVPMERIEVVPAAELERVLNALERASDENHRLAEKFAAEAKALYAEGPNG